MNTPTPTSLTLGIALALLSGANLAASFRYDGILTDGSQPANGSYDLRLSLFRDAKTANTLAYPMTFERVTVQNGRFTLPFDLDLPESAQAWVAVEVRDAGQGSYHAIGGRSKAIEAGPIGQCWSTTGDSGSNPSVHFLGTTDAQPLVLRTGSAPSLRLEPSAILDGSGLPVTANVIAGSAANAANANVRGATIAGGGLPAGDSDPVFALESPNLVFDSYAVIGGGYGNQAGTNNANVDDAAFATIASGALNKATGLVSTVAGGEQNYAQAQYAFIGGGRGNRANGEFTSISGGKSNTADGLRSHLGGGELNTVSAAFGTVSGGFSGDAGGDYSVVIGGKENEAFGYAATSSGGESNCAGGSYSWAGGNNAQVRRRSNGSPAGACQFASSSGDTNGDEGSFVWADSQSSNFSTTAPDQFLVRARGGVGINSAPSANNIELTIAGSANGSTASNVFLKERDSNRGILFSAGDGADANDSGFYLDHFNGSSQARRLALAPDGSVTIRSNVTQANTGVSMAANSGAWTSLSDRRVKTAITAIDPRSILERLIAMPVSTWSYIAQGTDVRHIGPMAQDFMAAFQVGETETGINTIDADGVAMAAIQGLNQKLESENAKLARQAADLATRAADLEADNQAIRAELQALRDLIQNDRAGH